MVVDDINLLDTDLVTMMLQAKTDGFGIVERGEGKSVKFPYKPILICTMNTEDSDLKDGSLDHIGKFLFFLTNSL